MKKIGVSLLAYGDEHIDECNYLINSLSQYEDELKFIVGTDAPEKIDDPSAKTIKITDEFNYNLKRVPIKAALDEFDVVLVMDTDMFIKGKDIDFSMLYDVDDGIYVWWMDREAMFMGEKITNKGDGSSDVNNEYLRKLHQLNNTPEDLFFIDECFFLIKLTDDKKKEEFIKNWNYLYDETLYAQPSNGIIGAMEGVIIHLSCVMSDMKMYNVMNDRLYFDFFCNFYHCNYVMNKEDIFKHKPKKMI